MMRPGNWILSQFSNDLIFIFLPGIASIAIFSRLPSNSIYLLVYAFFASTIVDSGHVYTTAWRTFFRKEERNSHPLYWIAPLTIITGVFLWVYFRIPYLWSFVVYATIYHHMTQFYGFLRWYQKLNKRISYFSGYFLFALILIPFILFHFRSLPNERYYTDQDIFFYPNPAFFKIGLFIYASVVIAWLVFEAVLIYKKHFELNRFLALLAPAFLYAYCFLVGKNSIQILLPLLLSHGIPYMAVMSLSLGRLDPKAFHKVYKAVGIIALTAVVGGVANTLYETYVITISNGYVQNGISVIETLLIGIYLVPLFCHYVFDGYLWKSKHKDARLIYSNRPAL